MKKLGYLLVLSSTVLSLIGCNGGSGSSSSSDVTHKTITVHQNSQKTTTADFYFFNKNTEIPYLEIQNTFKTLTNPEAFSIKFENNVYTVKNLYTDSTMSIDTSGNVSFPDFTRFHCVDEASKNCYIDEFASKRVTDKKIEEQSSYSSPTEYKLDLSKFNFKPVLYESNYYLPLNVIHALLAPDYGTYYYDGKGEIYLFGADDKVGPMMEAKTNYSKEFYEYCFNQFALNVELYFGLKGYSRTFRNNSKVHTYMPNGTLEAFNPYKERIISSKSLAEFDTNINTMLNETMNDGGHTTGGESSFGNEAKLPDSEEVTYLNNLAKSGHEKRKASADSKSFESTTYVYDADEDGKYDVGYITFDTFASEKEVGSTAPTVQEIFQGENGANQALNKYADGYDTTEMDIKDVIIDISLNTGGDVDAEGFVLSWICGGIAQETLRSNASKITSKYTYNFDVNGDGVYDHKDYLGDDVNVYLLVSPVTYSAANALAFNTYLYNDLPAQTRKVKIIGQQSGGGAASVTGYCYLPTGLSYRLAANDVSIYPNDATKSCEDGVTPIQKYTLTFDNIFNRNGTGGINQFVLNERTAK